MGPFFSRIIHDSRFLLLAQVHSAALRGIDSFPIVVEVDVATGLPGFSLVGLPDSSVKEARERVFAALKHAGYVIPSRRITINLAPADWKKEGASLDLPLALGLLVASEQIQIPNLSRWIIAGELSLDGTLRSIRGALTLGLHALQENYRGLLIPGFNYPEAHLVASLKVLAANTLAEAIYALQNPDSQDYHRPVSVPANSLRPESSLPDFSELRGQTLARRALEVAAAGGHHFVLIGSPGCGKTMMARRVPGILPAMSPQESLETTRIYGSAGLLTTHAALVNRRPFRHPHHTASPQALVGGGMHLRPGEASLAHHGLLFLDECPEFRRSALEALRQPLEDGEVHLSRVGWSVRYPCRFMLGAAMNPCPCGYLFDSLRACTCAPEEILRYRRRISGPLLDRIDLHIEVPRLEIQDMANSEPGERSQAIRQRVELARQRQTERFQGMAGLTCNASMSGDVLNKYVCLDAKGQRVLIAAVKKLGLSARAYDRVLKVARTIADLEGGEDVRSDHVAEAIAYRSLDRNLESNSSTITS